MPVGVTLSELRTDLRAETGQSLSMSQGVQSQLTQDNQLNRQQTELWDAWHWPHLSYWVDKPYSAGQDTYDFPADMPFDQIVRIMIAEGGSGGWKMLRYGIQAYDTGPTASPGTPIRWGNQVSVVNGKTDPVGKMLIVPTPTGAGTMRFVGQAPCNRMVDPTDICVIDSKAIVLFAAAEILAFQKVEAAALKLTKAQNYLRKLLQNSGADKRSNYNMGGSARSSGIDHFGARPYRNYVPGIDYIPS